MEGKIVKVAKAPQVSVPKDIAKALSMEVGDRLTVRLRVENSFIESLWKI